MLIVGCGYAGSMLAQRLAFQGRPVYATTRSQDRAQVIRSRGAEPLILDAFDPTPLDRMRGRVGAVVSCVPPAMEEDGGYRDPNEGLMRYLAPWELRAFVYVSSTSVYGDRAGQMADEETPPAPDSPRGAARVAIETKVLSSGLRAMVVRPAGIYGPGRSQLHRLAAGRLRLVDGGGAYTNRIHVHDLAAILEACIDRGTPGDVYLASDQRPATQVEVVDHILATYGLPAPAALSLEEARVRLTRDVLAMVTGSKRLDPSRTLRALGVELRFPDYQAGLAEIWRREGDVLRDRT